MKYRLLLDAEVVDFVALLKRSERQFLRDCFERIRHHPGRFADYQQRDPSGRLLNVHVAGRFAIIYWDDFSDRHLKIMEIRWADNKG